MKLADEVKFLWNTDLRQGIVRAVTARSYLLEDAEGHFYVVARWKVEPQ